VTNKFGFLTANCALSNSQRKDRHPIIGIIAAGINGTDLRWFPFGLSLSKPSLPFDKLRVSRPIRQAIAHKSVPLPAGIMLVGWFAAENSAQRGFVEQQMLFLQ
jgi:hypothetical protein